MLLVCAPVTKKNNLEKQIAPETLLAQISAENGRPEQSEGIPGEFCRSILLFFRRPCFHGQRSTRSKPPAWESLFVRVPAFFFSPAALASDLRAFACVFLSLTTYKAEGKSSFTTECGRQRASASNACLPFPFGMLEKCQKTICLVLVHPPDCSFQSLDELLPSLQVSRLLLVQAFSQEPP